MSDGLQDGQDDRGTVWRIGLITFSRAQAARLPARLPARLLVSLPVSLALSGCATGRPPVLRQPDAAVATTGPAYGSAYGSAYATVAAVRPIAGTASASDPRREILAAMGVSPSIAAGSAAPSEIIVRTDDGQTLSVIQPDVAGLAPGARVMVVPGGSGGRLVPAPPAS